MINIKIDDIAKVKQADIDLLGMTVIAGFNGSGKSTIAKTVFAGANSLKDIYTRINNEKFDEIYEIIDEAIDEWLSKLEEEAEEDEMFPPSEVYTDELSNDIYTCLNRENISEPEELADDVRDIIEKYFDSYEIDYIDVDDLKESVMEIYLRDPSEFYEFFVSQYYKNVFKNQINTINGKPIGRINYTNKKKTRILSYKISVQNNKVLLEKLRSLPRQEKAVYIETYSVLDLCAEKIRFRRFRSTDSISTPTMELMTYLNTEKELTYSEYQDIEKYEKIVGLIVEKATHGHLQKDSTGVLRFTDDNMEEKIEYSNLSSGIKIFAVLQRLLETHTLNKGDVLVIDEPEVNLHPKWQIVLAELLVMIYKELGIFVLVNSHSPYFIRGIEVNMAEYGCADDGKFYFMEEKDGLFVCNDVTDEKEIIYRALYEPLDAI